MLLSGDTILRSRQGKRIGEEESSGWWRRELLRWVVTKMKKRRKQQAKTMGEIYSNIYIPAGFWGSERWKESNDDWRAVVVDARTLVKNVMILRT